MNSISLASSIAMLVGLGAALPQLIAMLRSRSASGQSIVGWSMGLVTNASLGYVNLFGFHAPLLVVSNVVSASLCIGAIVLIGRFRSRVYAPAAPIVDAFEPVPARPGSYEEMPTAELVALRSTLDEITADRQARAALQAA